MTIEIRPIQTLEEYREIEQVQRRVWGCDDVSVVPDHMTLTIHRHGGLALGAFDAEQEGRMVGFLIGLVALSPAGDVSHWSHMMGVLPEYRDRSIGQGLKLAQRRHVQAQGIDLIEWTFDPLESRNAYLNFHKLGVVCDTYLRNVYGNLRNEINASLPTDRFQVAWHIDSPRVAVWARGAVRRMALSGFQAQGVRIVNPAVEEQGVLRPASETQPLEDPLVLVQIPADLQAIKVADLALAAAWREHTRALFERVFDQGYTAVDLLFEAGKSCYLLEKDFTLDET
jgi:predicted GNAT superfamily acetyltransferase